jgi:hypothetical protein
MYSQTHTQLAGEQKKPSITCHYPVRDVNVLKLVDNELGLMTNDHQPLLSLNPLVDPIAEFHHPLMSMLSLSIALSKMPHGRPLLLPW